MDAGQSTPTPSPAPSAPEQGISEQRAREIALADAGVSEDSVTAIRVKRDVEKGVYVYDVEFYAGGKEYDYEIAAADGSILKKDFEVEDHCTMAASPPRREFPKSKRRRLRFSGCRALRRSRFG